MIDSTETAAAGPAELHPFADDVPRGGFRLGCHGCHVHPRNDRRRPLWALANAAREQGVRAEAFFRGAVQRMHGPEAVDVGPEELVVLCLGRDSSPWIQSFIEHHLALGATHVVYLDNASSDDSVARASRYDRVTVLRTELSFRRYEVGLRRWLTRRWGRNRWSLFCDNDELFDYPHSDRLPLPLFLRYLKTHGYKTVATQMLDLFSDVPFDRLDSRPEDSLREKYRFYDLSDLVWTKDVWWIRDGLCETPEIACSFGGIRKRFFGDDCLLLTKHPLVWADDAVGLYSYDGHFMNHAPVADVSAVLLHYKYVGSLGERARRSVQEQWHKESRSLYRGLSDVLADDPDLTLKLPTAQELTDVQQLVDQGYLVASERYVRWVERYGK